MKYIVLFRVINRKNNKCNKIQDLEREKAEKDPEKSANVAKITKIFLATTPDKTVETIPSIFQLLALLPSPLNRKSKLPPHLLQG